MLPLRSFSLIAASALILAGFSGCQSRSSDAVLLKKDPGSSVTYRVPGENDIPYATNVVYVPRDARFSLSFDALNPGWLHQSSAGKPGASLAGKDLWMILHVRTLSSNDALQVESKRISRASLVKHDLRSFGLIPLTVDEITPFSLEANTDYEVEIRLYEVSDAFRRPALAGRPGLTGVARTAWTTATDTFKSLIGDSATQSFDGVTTTDLPIERQLLASGGDLQFEARFAIYRSEETLAPRHPDDDSRGGTLINRYQLTDPYNRRETDHRDRRRDARYADATAYLDRIQTLEALEVPGRQDAFLRFRIESMWSPHAKALAQLQATPRTIENVSEEQALAAEALATTARNTFLRIAEEEKQAGLTAAEALRKTGDTNPAQLEETARALSRKTQEVAAARAAMETAQVRAREARQAVEADASRAAQTANAEKTAAIAVVALEDARRAVEAALQDLDNSRAALQQTREAAEAARLKKEEWMAAEARENRRLESAREDLSKLAQRVEKRPDDTALRERLAHAERRVADASKAAESAAEEWKLAQKDQEAKLNAVEDHIEAVAQKRLILAEKEQERQRARLAKDRADAILIGTDSTDPRPDILRARNL